MGWNTGVERGESEGVDIAVVSCDLDAICTIHMTDIVTFTQMLYMYTRLLVPCAREETAANTFHRETTLHLEVVKSRRVMALNFRHVVLTPRRELAYKHISTRRITRCACLRVKLD